MSLSSSRPAPAVPAPTVVAGKLVRCHDCDLLQAIPALPKRTRAECERCGAELVTAKPDAFRHAFALYVGSLILLVIANAFPFLTLKVQGHVQASHLLSGAVDLWREGMGEVAIAIVLFVFVVPLCKIGIGLLVMGPLASGRTLRGAAGLYRMFDRLHPWAMTEIFLLGVLVAYTKLIDLATVQIGPSLYAFVAMIVTMILADVAVDPHEVWERLRGTPRQPLPPADQRARLVGCHTCHLVVPMPDVPAGEQALCPRCGAILHRRKPDSLARTAALVATAAMLYIPANLYPVMTFSALGSGEPSTIIGGVMELIGAHMWPLAAIVFVASILVPMLKLISMSYLVLATRNGSRWRLKDRTLIYRMNEAVGRWSMVDVFVIAILVALVQLGSIASIVPDVGILAFCSVVVLTMLAALSFDPRLMWDAAGVGEESDGDTPLRR